MEISEIYIHDAILHRVIENIVADTLTMELELPILERNEELEPRLLVFEGAYNYKVFEGPWQGSVTILSMRVIARRGTSQEVRIETNAGYRKLCFTSARVVAASA